MVKSAYPVVSAMTKDKLTLHGLLHRSNPATNRIVLHTHGSTGNFYFNKFYPYVVRVAASEGFSFLQTNNRGAGNYEYELGVVPHGAALELFEDSLLDLDAWIEYCLDQGLGKIVLSGHSFGTEKIIYYLNKGKYRQHVIGVILLGFCDSVGTQARYEKKVGKSYIAEANKLEASGNGLSLLSDIFAGIAGEAPLSARSYLNFYSPGSELSGVMPLRLGGKLEMYSRISVPILAIIGDSEEGEYTIIPIREAMELMCRENKLTQAHQIKNCDHGFSGHEVELASLVGKFLGNLP